MQSVLHLSTFILIIGICFDSVTTYCIHVRCKRGTVPIYESCTPGRPVKRSAIGDRDCHGHDKIFVPDQNLDQPGKMSIDCPDGWVFNREMQCEREGWEPNSGPWETHHYTVRGRNVVMSVKRSDTSCRYRYLRIQ